MPNLPKRLGARTLKVTPISTAAAADFYRQFHRQGAPSGDCTHLGLRDAAEVLIACMSFSWHSSARGAAVSSTRADLATLTRYATAVRVPGGASRLLTHWRRAHPEVEVKSFSDPRFFTGDMYAALGFVRGKDTAASYAVLDPVTGAERHKSQFQRSRLERWRIALGREDVPAFHPLTDPRSERQMLAALGLTRVDTPGLYTWRLPALSRAHYLADYHALVEAHREYIEKPKGWEGHHIRPRAWGGGNAADNIVHLPPRAHAHAHWLLHLAFPHDQAMSLAAFRSSRGADGERLPPEAIDALRQEHAQRQQQRMRKQHADPAFQAKRKVGHAKWMSTGGAAAMSSGRVRSYHELTPADKAAQLQRMLDKVQKAVTCLDTQVTYASTAEAARALGRKPTAATHIGSCANGAAKRATAYGLRWAWADAPVPATAEAKRKAVRCTETLQSFESVAAAVRWLRGTGHPSAAGGAISECCAGKRRTAYGFRWSYS